jgi:hypothetical protein
MCRTGCGEPVILSGLRRSNTHDEWQTPDVILADPADLSDDPLRLWWQRDRDAAGGHHDDESINQQQYAGCRWRRDRDHWQYERQ